VDLASRKVLAEYLRFCAAACAALGAVVLSHADAEEILISPFRERGGQVHWSPKGWDRIAYAAKGADGYFDIHLANPDGSNDVCLTERVAGLPHKHMGSPAWHPSGRYIVFVAEKAEHPGSSIEAVPGFGGYTDIWCITTDGQRAFRLTDFPNDPDHGVICPRFSPEGKRLVWSGRVERPKLLNPKRTFGYWSIKTADFVETRQGPRLANLRSSEPGGRAFYETYGFSPDGTRVIFCSSMNQPSVWTQQIYTIDATLRGDVQQLTWRDYNEHAFYTPDGKSIVWMTNCQSKRGGTDWWMMDADGGRKRRLTYFNERRHPHDMGHAVWAGLGSFSPDGRRFVGDIQTNLITQESVIKIVELAPGQAGEGDGGSVPRRARSIRRGGHGKGGG
jgi:Tol biopolymer transport system component